MTFLYESSLTRIALAFVLLAAVVGKKNHSREALTHQLTWAGIPASAANILARLVLPLELLGLALLSSPWFPLGAALLVPLFLGFTWYSSKMLARGGGYLCGCFGNLIPLRIGYGLLLLDICLLGGAAFLAVGNVMGSGWSELGLWMAVSLTIGAALYGLQLWTFKGEVSQRTRGPTINSPLPHFSVTTIDDVRLDSDASLACGTVLIMFLRWGCASCKAVADRLPENLGRDRAVVVVDSAPGPRWLRQGQPGLYEVRGEAAHTLAAVLTMNGWPAVIMVHEGIVRWVRHPVEPRDVDEIQHLALSGAV